MTLRKTTKVWNNVTAYTDTNIEASGPVSTSGKLSLDGLFVAADPGSQNVTYLADLNQDGEVTVGDLLEFLVAFGEDVTDSAADLNNDGVVNVPDLLLLLSEYGGSSNNISAYLAGINIAASASPITLYAVTPGTVDGEAARGNYADVTVNLNGDFELDVVNLDYEPTTLDHSR